MRGGCGDVVAADPAEITALPGALDKPPPARAWLPNFAKAEWARVLPAQPGGTSIVAEMEAPTGIGENHHLYRQNPETRT